MPIDERPAEAVKRIAERDAVPPDELTMCRDCGIDAWGFEEDGQLVQEDFNVSNALWDATCPDDEVVRWTEDGSELGQGRFVLCIGCFERRLGRELTLLDFVSDADALSDIELDALSDEGPVLLLGGEPIGPPPSRRYRDRWASRPSRTP